jgi:dTDP-glucose pyrophosphorylase
MVAIQRGTASAAFAVHDDQVLAGLVTDGDLRRALLEGAQLSDPVNPFIRVDPIVVSAIESRSSVIDLMRARGISQIPVVDSSGRVIGVHLMSELLGRVERPNLALLLAGGRGTRLHPLTYDLPKSMIPVAGTPILERLINHLVGFGVKRIAISVGYLAAVIEDHFSDGSQFGCEITYLKEDPDDPQGTGGPLSNLPNFFPELQDPILVLNGDLITQFDVASMFNHHNHSQSMATIGTINYSHEVPYGVLSSNVSGEVTAIVEKPVWQESVSGGVYILDSSIPRHVPADIFVPMTQVINDCIGRKERVTMWLLDQAWVDVGRHEDLARAQGVE